jgi:probable HAF family extracellular repeat protein
MKKVSFRCRLAGILAGSAWLVQTGAAQTQMVQPYYTVTDLGLVGLSPGPAVLKNNGLIASSTAFQNGWHASISIMGMAQIDLAKAGGLGGVNSAAFGVNEWGQAAGAAETKDSDPKLEDFCTYGTGKICKAFIWQNGVMSALPLLTDATGAAGHNANAKGINILGQVAGVAENTTPDATCPPYNPSSTSLQFQYYQQKPVIWSNGEIQPLFTSGSDVNGKAFSDPDGVVFRINDSGQAVGATGTCSGFTGFSYVNAHRATLWQGGSVIDLGNLGGTLPPPAGFGNFAYDINTWGHVVGTFGTSNGSQHAFFWSPETRIQDVGTLPGDIASVGLSISDTGDVGGVSFPADPNASPRAFIRPDGGTMMDLNTLIPANSELYLFSTCSINPRGEIVGLAFDAQGNLHGYLATPSSGAVFSSAKLSPALPRFEYAWGLIRERLGPFGGLMGRR